LGLYFGINEITLAKRQKGLILKISLFAQPETKRSNFSDTSENNKI
jgi:hypothetical protein